MSFCSGLTVVSWLPSIISLCRGVEEEERGGAVPFTFKTSQKATLLLVSLVRMCLLSFRMWHWMMLAPPADATQGFSS